MASFYILGDALAAGLGFGMNGAIVIPIWYLVTTLIGIIAGAWLWAIIEDRLSK